MPAWPDYVRGADGRRRCGWCGDDPLYQAYHDREWGLPLSQDKQLFELLILEGAQAGLSWITILRKREAYRRAYQGFDPAKVARFGAAKQAALLKNPGLVRNRLKLQAAVANARGFLQIQREFGAFAPYAWSWVGGRSRRSAHRSFRRLPSSTPESLLFSKDLQRRGFRFVGPTIVYAFMQAAGIVNDHLTGCYRWVQIAEYRFRRRGA